jgi:hypothetical protein
VKVDISMGNYGDKNAIFAQSNLRNLSQVNQQDL